MRRCVKDSRQCSIWGEDEKVRSVGRVLNSGVGGWIGR